MLSSRLEYFAELNLFVVWTLDEEVAGSVVPEGDVLNAVGDNLVAGILHLLVEGFNVLDVQAEVVDSSVRHSGVAVGDEFEVEVSPALGKGRNLRLDPISRIEVLFEHRADEPAKFGKG